MEERVAAERERAAEAVGVWEAERTAWQQERAAERTVWQQERARLEGGVAEYAQAVATLHVRRGCCSIARA